MIDPSSVKRYSFKIGDLNITTTEIASKMGYDGNLPGYIGELIDEELKAVAAAEGVEGGYMIKNFNPVKEGFQIQIENVSLYLGEKIWRYLKNSSQIVIYAVTAGSAISSRPGKLMEEGKITEAYLADVTGSLIATKTADKVWEKLNENCNKTGNKITNMYSPGYCNWSVDEQHKLFSLLPENFCGIEINKSAMMTPMKSISGLIGVGKAVRYRTHNCKDCSDVNCLYR